MGHRVMEINELEFNFVVLERVLACICINLSRSSRFGNHVLTYQSYALNTELAACVVEIYEPELRFAIGSRSPPPCSRFQHGESPSQTTPNIRLGVDQVI